MAATVAFVELRANGDDASAGGLGPQGGSAPGGAATTAAGPLSVSVATERAAETLDRRGDAIEMRELAGALAAATDDGGSPIAVLIAPTALREAPGGRVLARLGTKTEFGSPRVHAIAGHEGRWLEVIAAELPNTETGWIRAEDADVEGVDHSLHATLGERTLEVLERGHLVRRMEIAVGGPETPTPTGTFAVTDKLTMTDDGSPYGCCLLAFTGHQPNVPQGWAGGDRLAVHATPDTTTIGEAATLGCFRASDEDMRWLLDEVPLGAPVRVVR